MGIQLRPLSFFLLFIAVSFFHIFGINEFKDCVVDVVGNQNKFYLWLYSFVN